MTPRKKLHNKFFMRCRRLGIKLSRYIISVSIQRQQMELYHCIHKYLGKRDYRTLDGEPANTLLFKVSHIKTYRISTSRFGIGQLSGSNKTPLGLHRIRKKVGAGYPIGTVFSSRKEAGLTWQGVPNAGIAHRIMWLEGLESGFNRGGLVDSYSRYIYIHGVGDETTLGRPASRGCIHMAADDLMPLFQKILTGTLVWIAY